MYEVGYVEIFRVDNFVSVWGIEDCFGVDVGFVMKGWVVGNVVIERDIDFNS